MIKIDLAGKYKSLGPFKLDMPDFVVLTGLNGAGKTQLLTAIKSGSIKVVNSDNQLIQPVKYASAQTMMPNDITDSYKKAAPRLNNTWGILQQLLPHYLSVKAKNPDVRLDNATRNLFQKDEYPNDAVNEIYGAAKNANKRIEDLDISDLYVYSSLKDNYKKVDIFHQNFSDLFKQYSIKFEENEYREYKNSKRSGSYPVLSKKEFIDIFGEAPWITVNKIFLEANINYHVNSPGDIDRDELFKLRLISNYSGVELDFKDLSSGEKIIMSLALALYNANFGVEFPGILLLDEPDSLLHPSMIKQFIDVLNNFFVKNKGIKVFLVTHSPSTVALVPEDSLFVVDNKSPQVVRKVSKDNAIKVLTSGVPSFSILYENRRQIFVESPYDVMYYEKLYRKFSNILNQDISLNFISAGDSRKDERYNPVNGCAQVKEIVNTLRKYGNKFIWGIIDRDNGNTGNAYVKVLGEGTRYSVENFILDPLLIAALLLRGTSSGERISKINLGLCEDDSYIGIGGFDNLKFQTMSDFIVKGLDKSYYEISEINGLSKDDSMCASVLLNDASILIPKWYFECQGHILESLLLKTFPLLNQFKLKKEEGLKLSIIETVVEDHPGLVSTYLIKIFEAMQAI